ncbi:hypothetical protein U8V72_19810 [Priestia filamentosa]|uniref:hypothetical protein n=1 Tax=Priestia filamentosa TaxID=1402861 RepID=UPI000A58FB0F
MGKLINLLPPSIKHERQMKTAKQTIVYFVVACAGSTVFFNWYEKHLDKQIASFKSQISSYDSQQKEVESLNKNIQLTDEQKDSISTSSFPYHRFLYFIMTHATEDTRILSVQSISPNSKLQDTALTQTSGSATTNSQTGTTNSSATTGQTTQTSQTASTTSSGTTQSTTSSNTQPTSSPVPGTTTTNGTSENGETTEGTETPVVEKSPFIFDTSEIYIRGYVTYPDSVAKLANQLKKEDYISDVKATKVRDYYTGLNNFKLFEMKITYK